MRKTRELVTGMYVNPKTYVLTREDKSIFQIITEGEPFTIGNQMRPWFPVRVPYKDGYGTIMVCRKYRDNGDVISEFPLIHGRMGLWALTSGAARRGVFHRYTPPKDEIEAELCRIGFNPNKLERVNKIDLELELGGKLCKHISFPRGYKAYTDAKEKRITEPTYVSMEFPNWLHRGCMDSTYNARLYEGTYLVYTQVKTRADMDDINEQILRVLVTRKADEQEIISVLRKFEP